MKWHLMSSADLAALEQDVQHAQAEADMERARADRECLDARHWRQQAEFAHSLLDEAWPRASPSLRARITGWAEEVGFDRGRQ